MSLSLTGLAYDAAAGGLAATTPPEDNQPPKRQKPLACLRCRRRKQKCDEQRPCTNCARSDEMCQEVAPRLGVVGSLPLVSPVDVGALEERVARLEKAQYLEQRRSRATAACRANGSRRRSHMGGGAVASAAATTATSSFPAPEQGCCFRDGEGRPSSRNLSVGTTTGTGSPSFAGSAPAIGLLAAFARPDGEHGNNNNRVGGMASTITAVAGLKRKHDSLSSSCSSSSSHMTPASSPSSSDHHLPTPVSAGGGGGVGLPGVLAPAATAPVIDPATESAIFGIYAARVHSRYAFLPLALLREPARRPAEPWVGFFVSMVHSIGLLLMLEAAGGGGGCGGENGGGGDQLQAACYRTAVTRHLGAVFAHPDRILHVQAYLLLGVHALHAGSTERVVSVAGAGARYCVLAGLHLDSAEREEGAALLAGSGMAAGTGTPPPVAWLDRRRHRQLHAAADVGRRAAAMAFVEARARMRRSVFWSAYALDRAVGAAFGLPVSVADAHITTGPCGDGLEDWGCGAATSASSATTTTAALHLIRLRRIQSEILSTTLHRDCLTAAAGSSSEDRQAAWRARMREKLDRWRGMCRSLDAGAGWLDTMYHLSVVMLHPAPPPVPPRPHHPVRDFAVVAHGVGFRSTINVAAAAAATLDGRRRTTDDSDNDDDDMEGHRARQGGADPQVQQRTRACARACLAASRRLRAACSSGGMSAMGDAPWLTLVEVFRCGVVLLHLCRFGFKVSPPPLAAAAVSREAVEEAIRACRGVLSELTERWPRSRCLLEVFGLLAALVASARPGGGDDLDGRGSQRASLGPGTAGLVLAMLPQLELVVVHRDTLRMIREMAAADEESPPSQVVSCYDEIGVFVEQGGARSGQSMEGSELKVEDVDEGVFADDGGIEAGLGVLQGDDRSPSFEEEVESMQEDENAFALPATPHFYLPEPQDEVDREQEGFNRYQYRHYDYLDLGLASNSVEPALPF